ncbi:MAG: transcriptional regulator [Planctomycetia bacterium]|nr:transcriptional regulator [Planctomycetia bacterium]
MPRPAATKRSTCPVACTLDLVGDRWTLLVVRDLACGKCQFKELAASPERIATNILSDRLRKLVAAGLAETFPTPGAPTRAAYRLTARGRSLGPIVASIAVWGRAHIRGTHIRLHPRF